MSRACGLMNNKSVMVGNNVSHSKRRTRRRFLPNLQNVTLRSNILNQNFKFRIAARTLRTIDFKGGFDDFLFKTKNNKLTEEALKLKRQIKKKLAAQTASSE